MIDRDRHGMVSYWVPPYVRLCVTATGAVVLDLKRTRYFGMGARETRALAILALNWPDVSVVEGTSIEPMSVEDATGFASALVNAGLLATTSPSGEPLICGRPGAVTDRQALEPDPPGKGLPRVHHVLALARALRWAKRAIRTRELYSIVHEVSLEKKQLSFSVQLDKKQVVESVSAFRRLRPHIFAARDQCLLHALTLTKYLILSSAAPTWVIAVRPRPWAAHSWVQLDNLLLDSSPEEINGYTPILAV